MSGAIGSLRHMVVNDAPNCDYLLADPADRENSTWVSRGDVQVWWRYSDIGQTRAIVKVNLDTGFAEGRNADWFGPEYGFGWMVGEHLNEPILLIKTCWGGKSLDVDCRPPSAVAARYKRASDLIGQLTLEVEEPAKLRLKPTSQIGTPSRRSFAPCPSACRLGPQATTTAGGLP